MNISFVNKICANEGQSITGVLQNRKKRKIKLNNIFFLQINLSVFVLAD